MSLLMLISATMLVAATLFTVIRESVAAWLRAIGADDALPGFETGGASWALLLSVLLFAAAAMQAAVHQ